MDDNRFLRTSRYLRIGDFGIAYAKRRSDVHLEIPLSGMAFYHPEGIHTDFRLELNLVEPDDSGALLFGSADFSVPTFLYRRENGGFDWLTQTPEGQSALSFRISPDWTKFTLYGDETQTDGAAAFREFGSLFSYAVLSRHACVLHGVVMEYDGMGVLVTAPSGTGKTTHTRMWRDRENALILNGDRALCRKRDGVWYAYGMPWAGSSGEYINRRAPISAIVTLRQAAENRVRRLPAFEGCVCLMQRIFAPVWRGTLQNRALDLTEELAAEIPMLELFCRPDYEAVDVLKRALLALREAT